MNTEDPCIAVLIGTLKPGAQDLPEFHEYARRSAENGEAHGGKVLGKYQIVENLGQGTKPDVVFVVEYPSRKIANDTFISTEYTSIISLRDAAFEEVKILLSARK